jgi:hypothetical protein
VPPGNGGDYLHDDTIIDLCHARQKWYDVDQAVSVTKELWRNLKMSDDFYYPALDPQTMKNIGIIQRLALEHPSYWLQAPYSGDIQLQLMALFLPRKVGAANDAPVVDIEDDDRDNWEFLFEESKTLYRNLKGAQPSGDEPTAQMGYFRTATSLLEKLLSMSERAMNLKQVSDFYQLVMDVMESTLTGPQRTEVMEKLQAKIKGN